MNNYCVYCHTSPSNRKYVGISCDPQKRWNKGRGYSKNYIFYRAIKKYGWDNIKHEILYEGLTLEEAKEIEESLISEWNLTNRAYGYNLSSLKDGMCEESKKLMSLSRMGNKNSKGKVRSEETKKEISNSLKKYYSNPCNRESLHRPHTEATKELLRHRKFSEETRAKMREHHYNCAGANNPSAKPVRQLSLSGELVKEYEYATIASNELNLDLSSIIKCCRGKIKSCGGFRWEYK